MGTLYVVGLGPGAEDLLTPRARRALERAQAVVGYERYTELVRRWLPAASLHPSPIGAEVARVRQALRLAAELEHVALVCSGDAGVYGLAGLVYELRASTVWKHGPPAVEVIPGVTAATAAAALLGAPLGHDFAAVSLSDLLTPWEVIRRRLAAVAAADFVIALYNPASPARQHRLAEACAILLRHRPAGTPVGIVTNAEREGQQVVVTTLDELPTSGVGMLSIVIVGNTQTRVQDGCLVTPRGYRLGDVPPRSEAQR